jgi:hypothetical protein
MVNHSMYSIKQFVRNRFSKYLKQLFANVVCVCVCVCVTKKEGKKNLHSQLIP